MIPITTAICLLVVDKTTVMGGGRRVKTMILTRNPLTAFLKQPTTNFYRENRDWYTQITTCLHRTKLW